MNFIDYIKHIVKLRGYDFAYGDMYEINRKLNDIDFEKSKDGIVSFAYIITESEGGDRQSATVGIYFCKLCPFDLDANDTLDWQRTLRNAANTMFSDIAAGNISRTSNHRFNYGYNDFAENVLWVCARFDIESLTCGCNEFVFRDEIVRRIEFVEVLENGNYRYKIIFNDGSFQFFESPRGPQGDDGPPGPPGSTDYNELQNKPTKLSDFENDSDFITSDDAAETYVVKESGKGLSSNDYTTAEKNKLAGIEAGAQKNPTAVSQLENDAQYISDNTFKKILLRERYMQLVKQICYQMYSLDEESQYRVAAKNVAYNVYEFEAGYNESTDKFFYVYRYGYTARGVKKIKEFAYYDLTYDEVEAMLNTYPYGKHSYGYGTLSKYNSRLAMVPIAYGNLVSGVDACAIYGNGALKTLFIVKKCDSHAPANSNLQSVQNNPGIVNVIGMATISVTTSIATPNLEWIDIKSTSNANLTSCSKITYECIEHWILQHISESSPNKTIRLHPDVMAKLNGSGSEDWSDLIDYNNTSSNPINFTL